MKKVYLLPIFLTVMLLSACASGATTPPTSIPVDINAVQTAAVQTVVAKITQTAEAQPTAAPTETPVPVKVVPTETAAPVPTATSSVKLCDNSVFVSDASVADGTHMAVGQNFLKSWRVRNTGSCTWKTSYKIIYAYGGDINGKMGGLATALPTEVQPGQEVEISVNLKAPQKAGNYSGYWRLVNTAGIPFGMYFSVIIAVP